MGVQTKNTAAGFKVGKAVTDKIGFYNATPVAQRAAAAQVALTDNSGGTASDTLAAISGTYSQAEVRNSIASLAAKINEIRTVLVNLGFMKGSA